jgi:hypothetical protein
MATGVRRLAALVGLLAVFADARGDGVSLYLEPVFTLTQFNTTDQLGTTTHQDLRALTQNYRLNFDRPLTPAFTIAAGALFAAQRIWNADDYQATTRDGSVRGLYGRLIFYLPLLSGGLTYDLGDLRSESTSPLVSENLSLYGSWRPMELPELNLRLSRTHQYDTARLNQDLTTVSVIGSARWLIDPFELRYTLQWAQPTDSVTGTESSALAQTLQGIYAARLFEGRTAIYLSLTLRNQMRKTIAAGTGNVSEQQHPVAGLSLLETSFVDPTNVTLLPNPALVDGNLVASAAVDIGYAAWVPGNNNRRDVGVQFADLLTPVNSIEVWVDKPLPPEVAIQYNEWQAYQSDDNKTWTLVTITGPVIFGPYQNENRFQIPIQETRARYLKVVTQPLSTPQDPLYANVFITEVQVFLVRSASSIPREQASSGALLNATASTLLWRAAQLSWDLTAIVEQRIGPNLRTWNLLNTLTGAQWLTPTLQLNERVSRQDGDDGLGHFGQSDWSAGLLWRPLPTFTGTLTYSGQFIDARPVLQVETGTYVSEPVGFNHSVSLLTRADLYEGISALVNASWGLQNEYSGTNHWNGTLNATGSFAPNPWVTFTLGWTSTLNLLQVPGEDTVGITTGRIDSSLTIRPTNSLSAIGTISRIVAGDRPTTFGTVQLNWSPFRGDLQLSLLYSKTFDVASQSTNEIFTPGLRWNVRQGIQFTAIYNLLNATAPVNRTNSRSLSLGLSILL